MSTKWFSALVVQEATHPDEGAQSPLFEADVVLITAESEEAARVRAEQIGKASEHEYLNSYGQRVVWTFRGVLDIKTIEADTIGNGTEVYHLFLSQEELGTLRRALEPMKDGAQE